MTCPECGGRREVTRRFLWFFTVRRPCPRCTPRVRDDRWDDDSWRRTDDSMSMPPVLSPMAGRDRNDHFEVGSGGRSGGAGAGAAWGDAREEPSEQAPLIVDPFPADTLPAERETQSDYVSAETESASSDEGVSGSDSGTAY